ncbi:MAG: lipid-A-disaccharide synthase [Bacteroidales bacterium]|nr:lipid-A-disaccharide synthase [Bacteroidales bacterium]
MKYFLIAGEASGDLHASNLMKQIKRYDPEADFMFLGGDLMQAQGGQMLIHYRDMAYMGLVEVLANLGKIQHNFKVCKQNLLEYNPDVLILVDYPGFNLKMAKFAKKHGLRTYYYISPKIWAWKKRRAYTIKKYIDKMFAIFPFEIDFYKQFDYSVEYVGNPLTDAMKEYEPRLMGAAEFRERYQLPGKPLIALVPGSRRSEIDKLLPEMTAIIPDFPDHQFVITGAPGIEPAFYSKYVEGLDNVKIIFGDTYNVVRNSEAAAVASGTATLETAFLRTPQVVCYKMNTITYWAAETFVRIKWFSLVNIIAGREVVKELLQSHLSKDISAEIRHIISDGAYRDNMLKQYDEIRSILGDGLASENTAKVIVESIKKL